jgi:sporulation protein YabP
MDKDNTISTMNHNITVTDRKNIMITGVKKIDSFDEEEFLMSTTMGYITLKGECLEIMKLDTFQGTVSIKGKINSFQYMDK